MFYTIIPLEYIFEEDEPEETESKKQKKDDIEIKREGGVSLMVEAGPFGQYKITRLISTNPNDYLKPQWQPGTIIAG
jgi:hypothetical protein